MKRVFIHMFLYSLEETIQLAKKYNIGAELSLNTEKLLYIKENDINEISQKCVGISGLSIHGPFRDLFPGSSDPDIREVALDRYIETLMVAKALNAEWVVFHLNYYSQMYGTERLRKTWLLNAIDTFSRIAELKIKVHIENTHENDPEIFFDLLKYINEKNFWMCLDVGHAHAYSNKDLEHWIELLSPYIREVHIHESPRGEDKHMVLGSGYINVNSVLNLIEERTEGDFVITLEPVTVEDLETNLNWLRENGWIR